nr:hypothetical protein GCM10017611_75050 [Rhodococcus wratislaviensis]
MLAAIDMTETSDGSNLVTEDDRADSSGRRNACVIIVTVERRKPLPVCPVQAPARPIVEKVLDPSMA